MGFLDRLWDETLAGPAPDKGLGKLRKYKSLSSVRSPDLPIVNTTTTRYQDHHGRRDDHDQTVPVSRSITILRTKSLTVEPGSAASSPSSSSTSSGPSSPFSPGATEKSPDVKRRMIWKKPTFEASEHAEPTSPVYDWIMISALDR